MGYPGTHKLTDAGNAQRYHGYKRLEYGRGKCWFNVCTLCKVGREYFIYRELVGLADINPDKFKAVDCSVYMYVLWNMVSYVQYYEPPQSSQVGE